MHIQRIAIIVSAIAGIISVFLPFIGISLVDYLKISSYGFSDQNITNTIYIIIAGYTISLIAALVGNLKNAIKNIHSAAVIIPGIIPAIIILIFVSQNLDKRTINSLSVFGIGFYLALIASLALLVFGFPIITNSTNGSEAIQRKTMFCSECGKEQLLDANVEFCEECGHKL